MNLRWLGGKIKRTMEGGGEGKGKRGGRGEIQYKTGCRKPSSGPPPIDLGKLCSMEGYLERQRGYEYAALTTRVLRT